MNMRLIFLRPWSGGRSSASLAQACCPLIATFWPPTHNHIRQSCSFIISNNKVAMFEFCCLHYLHAPLSVTRELLIGPNMCLRLWYKLLAKVLSSRSNRQQCFQSKQITPLTRESKLHMSFNAKARNTESTLQVSCSPFMRLQTDFKHNETYKQTNKDHSSSLSQCISTWAAN